MNRQLNVNNAGRIGDELNTSYALHTFADEIYEVHLCVWIFPHVALHLIKTLLCSHRIFSRSA